MKKNILFDIDGTLIDTLHIYIESYLKTIENYPDVKLLTPEEIKEINPTSEYRTIEKIVGKDRAEEAYGKFLQYYRQVHDDCFRGIYPGVSPLLETLRKKNFTMGLVTGKSRTAWEITYDKVQLGYFDVVITDNEVQNAKPDPEGLLKAMNFLNITPEEAANVIYVGDSPSDLEAADRAGVVFGGAVWSGWSSAEELESGIKKEGERHFLLRKPSDLLNYV